MRHHVVASLVKLGFVGAAAGCGEALPAPEPDPLPREVKQFPVTVSRDLDLLFLIDDSFAMLDKQVNLGLHLPHLLEELGASPGGLPNVHIGVVTSDLGSRGAADATPGPVVGRVGMGGCAGAGLDGRLQLSGAMVDDLFLSDIADPVTGVRTRNYAGELSVALRLMVQAGDRGCGFEQHLEAIHRALDPSNTFNQGFLRPDALLGVIILANEDDCSIAHHALLDPDEATLGPLQSFRCARFGVTCDQNGRTPEEMNQIGMKENCRPSDSSAYLTTVNDHAAFLKGLKPDPAKIVVAAIAGDTEPFATELRAPIGGDTPIPSVARSCVYVGGDGGEEVAYPAVRLQSFLDQFPDRSSFASICQRDLSGGLRQIGNRMKTALGIPCIENTLADTAPDAAGTQYDCTATVVTGPNAPGTALPRCVPEDASATNKPCFHLAADPASCPRGDHLAPTIQGRDLLARDAYVIASCAFEPNGLP